MSSKVQTYNLVSRLLHWLSAVIVFAMFGLGLWMVELNYYSSWYKVAPNWHKSIGILLFVLTLFRVIWKSVSSTPNIDGTDFEKKAAHLAHNLLYVLLFVLFVSGYLISTSDGRGIEVFGWFTVPGLGKLFEHQSDLSGTIHYYTALFVIGLAVLHALAALKHHYIDKDNTLRKMIGNKR